MATYEGSSPALAIPCTTCGAAVGRYCTKFESSEADKEQVQVRQVIAHKTRRDAVNAGAGRFAVWKMRAQICADKLEVVAGDDLFGEDDSYDLAKAAEEAFKKDQDPRDFVREMFAEDLASRAHDEDMARRGG